MTRLVSKLILLVVPLTILGFEVKASAGNLIVNGGFETETLDTTPGTPDAGSYVPEGWTLTGNVDNLTTGGNYDPDAHSGNWVGTFENFYYVGASGFSQTVATTPGQTYQLSFYYTNSDNSAAAGLDNQFIVTWDGNVLMNLVPPFYFNNVWQYATFTVTGTGSDTVAFSGYNTFGSNGVDDVSLMPTTSAVPEPSSVFLMGLGAMGLAIGACYRRRIVAA